MDVTKLKKVNELARELITKGMAEDSQTATTMAEQMINQNRDNEEKPLSDIKDNLEKSEKLPDDSDDDPNAMRKINYQLGQHQSMINEMQDKMNEMIAEFNALQESMKVLKRNVASSGEKQATLAAKDNSESGEGKVKQEKKPAEKPSNKGDSNPRSGEYNSDDVSIDKMFYFGK